jgi:hypothetical protein
MIQTGNFSWLRLLWYVTPDEVMAHFNFRTFFNKSCELRAMSFEQNQTIRGKQVTAHRFTIAQECDLEITSGHAAALLLPKN